MIILFDSGLRARVSVGDPVDDGVCFSLGSLVAHGSLNWRRARLLAVVMVYINFSRVLSPRARQLSFHLYMPTIFLGNLGLKRHDLGFQSRMLRTIRQSFHFISSKGARKYQFDWTTVERRCFLINGTYTLKMHGRPDRRRTGHCD